MNFMGFFFQPINLAGTALAVILSISIIKIFVGRLAEKKRRYHPIAGTVLHQLANYPSLHHYRQTLLANIELTDYSAFSGARFTQQIP